MKISTNRLIMVPLVLIFLSPNLKAQKSSPTGKRYWNTGLMINAMRLPPPPISYKPKLIDLDKDRDPDVLYTVTKDNVPVLWIDDDDDMKRTDLEGDTDSDCLLIDRNKDGKYGFMGDLILDWIDTNNDQQADMQALCEYPEEKKDDPWPNGHYMWVLDTDKDDVFNYIDWNRFEVKAWDRNGLSDFYLDYSGKSTFIKTHVATYTMDNLKLNWENPFLFYDPDDDGRSEIAVRLVDTPVKTLGGQDKTGNFQMKEKGAIDWISISVDLDNDNGPGNEFDFDFTLSYRGSGFNYMDQKHLFTNARVKEADHFFMDLRFRELNELIYADHNKAIELIFNRGKWDRAYFVYDEDDDCNRWERVELMDPLDPFKSGTGKGGLDNNVQADISGDRGEWDLDNSGKGQLYIGKFDGRLHLYGAEWGAWRLDQNASFYQGWDRKFLNKEPAGKFATVKYLDTDSNGFMDKLLYDLDGDKIFEDSIALKKIGVDDRSTVIDVANYKYADYLKLKNKMAEEMWAHSQTAIKVARIYNLNLSWYSKWLTATSLSQKYRHGYWLQFYIFQDLKDYFLRRSDLVSLSELEKNYYTSNWGVYLK